jgi:hypothetical protein
MTPTNSETIELCRADSGHDLWAAIEAAQYARLIDYDEPRTDEEASRMSDLIGLFAECAEQWERQDTSGQQLALEQLGIRLAALGEVGLFVYSTITQRRVETDEGGPVELPVAVLLVRREDRPAIAVELPGTMDAD